MSRLLSIDYGEKRVGVAITDPLKMIVKPFCTIDNNSEHQLFCAIKDIIEKQQIEKIIVGLPISVDGEDTAKTKEVRAFYEKLKLLCDPIACKTALWDERYSTSEANDFCKQKGLDWKESRKIIDQIAAAVILQSYLLEN